MNHLATPEFWFHYRERPEDVRKLANRCFRLFQADPRQPSLRLKPIGAFWSARVSLHYHAPARDRDDGLVWFWIGHHSRYDQLITQ
jgi:hypothetical protein